MTDIELEYALNDLIFNALFGGVVFGAVLWLLAHIIDAGTTRFNQWRSKK